MKNKEKAILLILLSTFSGSLSLVMVKLASNVPVYEDSFIRNTIIFSFALFLLKKEGNGVFPEKKNLPILFLRATCGTLSIWTSYYSIDHMMISNSTVLSSLSPLFAIVFGALFLKENIKPLHIILFLVSFAGVLFIVKPSGSGYFLVPSALAIVSSIFAGFVSTCLRFLGKSEKQNKIILFYASFSMIISIPLMIYYFKMPSLFEFGVLILSGILSTVTQISITNAFKLAAAKEISIYSYIKIIFTTLIGFIIWKSIPDIFSFIGYILIIGSSISIFFYNKRILKRNSF